MPTFLVCFWRELLNSELHSIIISLIRDSVQSNSDFQRGGKGVAVSDDFVTSLRFELGDDAMRCCP
jgi:hypothetical protein